MRSCDLIPVQNWLPFQWLGQKINVLGGCGAKYLKGLIHYFCQVEGESRNSCLIINKSFQMKLHLDVMLFPLAYSFIPVTPGMGR